MSDCTLIARDIAMNEDISCGAKGLWGLINSYHQQDVWPTLKSQYLGPTCGVEKLEQLLAELASHGLIRIGLEPQEVKKLLVSKNLEGQGVGPLVCSWCKCSTFTLEDHHFPKTCLQSGKKTIPICPTCHREYHALLTHAVDFVPLKG